MESDKSVRPQTFLIDINLNQGDDTVGVVSKTPDCSTLPDVPPYLNPPYPKNPFALVDLFEMVTSKPYSHLSIWANCPKELKFRSDITKSVQKVYIPVQ